MEKNDFFKEVDASLQAEELQKKVVMAKFRNDTETVFEFAQKLCKLLKDYAETFQQKGFQVTEKQVHLPYYSLEIYQPSSDKRIEIKIVNSPISNYELIVYSNYVAVPHGIKIFEPFNTEDIENKIQTIFRRYLL
jgi:hypothetical protein